MPEKDLTYLKHILDCINDIELFVEGYTMETFLSDKKTFNSSIRMFEIIGEASKRLSPAFISEHSQIPWKEMKGLRDVLIHDYEGVDLQAVWKIIQHNIPQLKKEIEQILKK